MIHVCFALYDKTGRYSKFTGTTMLSIFENTDSAVTVHILCDNTLSTENRDRLIRVAEKYNQRVEFYNVEELCAEKIAEILKLIPNVGNTRFSIGMFYRFFASKIFTTEIEKIIYLDSDIIVNMDIAELWQIELGEKPLAAVVESDNGVGSQTWFDLCRDGVVRAEDYFNSGVLLMNLNVFRAEEAALTYGIRFVAEHPQYKYPDQDALNWCFSTRFVKLPRKFNRFTRWAQGEPIGARIYHYTVNYLQPDMIDPFNRLWLEYFAETPWFDADSIGRLCNSIGQIYGDMRGAMIRLTAMISGKTRVFVVRKGDAAAIKKIFAVRDDEDVIISDKYTPLQEVFETLNSSGGKKILFVCVPDFPFVNFEKLGFVRGKDFINCVELLPEIIGVPRSFHWVIKDM